MKLDVVIPTLDGMHLLAGCLPPLLEAGKSCDLHIIVVDDGSTDGTRETGPSTYPSVEFLANDGERGFSHSVNLGVSHSDAELVMLLNNDVVVGPGSVPGMIEAISRAPAGVYSLMPSIIRNDGTDESVYGCAYRRGLARILTGEGTPYPSGACSIFRMDAWRRLGGLDTRYAPVYWEDVDLGLRAEAAGMRLVRDSGITVRHRHAATAGHGGRMRRIRERNRFILMDAHFRGRRAETAFLLPLHFATSLIRGRTDLVLGWLDYLAWKRSRI